MKNFVEKVLNSLKNKSVVSKKDNPHISIIGSWRLVQYSDMQGKEYKPRWKEVWSFAAMDEAETYGIYACDYINLHTIIGKWFLEDDSLKLVRKECVNEHKIVELSPDRLSIKATTENIIETFVFQRVS